VAENIESTEAGCGQSDAHLGCGEISTLFGLAVRPSANETSPRNKARVRSIACYMHGARARSVILLTHGCSSDAQNAHW